MAFASRAGQPCQAGGGGLFHVGEFVGEGVLIYKKSAWNIGGNCVLFSGMRSSVEEDSRMGSNGSFLCFFQGERTSRVPCPYSQLGNGFPRSFFAMKISTPSLSKKRPANSQQSNSPAKKARGNTHAISKGAERPPQQKRESALKRSLPVTREQHSESDSDGDEPLSDEGENSDVDPGHPVGGQDTTSTKQSGEKYCLD